MTETDYDYDWLWLRLTMTMTMTDYDYDYDYDYMMSLHEVIKMNLGAWYNYDPNMGKPDFISWSKLYYLPPWWYILFLTREHGNTSFLKQGILCFVHPPYKALARIPISVCRVCPWIIKLSSSTDCLAFGLKNIKVHLTCRKYIS